MAGRAGASKKLCICSLKTQNVKAMLLLFVARKDKSSIVWLFYFLGKLVDLIRGGFGLFGSLRTRIDSLYSMLSNSLLVVARTARKSLRSIL